MGARLPSSPSEGGALRYGRPSTSTAIRCRRRDHAPAGAESTGCNGGVAWTETGLESNAPRRAARQRTRPAPCTAPWGGHGGRSGKPHGATPTALPRGLPGRSPRGVLRAAVGRSSGSGHDAVRLLLAVASQAFAQCHDRGRFPYRCGAAPASHRLPFSADPRGPAPTPTTYTVCWLRQHQNVGLLPRPPATQGFAAKAQGRDNGRLRAGCLAAPSPFHVHRNRPCPSSA